ncbi:restriction endonuclease subunit M [Wohlfahrtiimonas chitiniclastica]|uniref:type I restriction-modification system subunit M n=1 Tax=Wohlfahrtiimonas chitiniclastica TaxID=400946 RepID=UPI000B99A72D|nr:class I SAM-dependent DNA methyltransferase [Wohlfahrtiimonas chitiniclastica]OYQ87049.1 restriction endonuclease subunit M [Wohlfahrtiimonas chitiniclastica]
MSTHSFSQTAAFLWSVADLLRGDFKQSQYGRIILPFTLLRRLECVFADSKEKVLSEYEKVQSMNLSEEMQEKMLLRVTNHLAFFNTSPLDLKKLGQADIKKNLNFYIQSFSKDAREIFDNFKFEEFLTQLEDANLLYKVTQIFANADLSPKAISNHDMGLVFEELIRRFAESSNETAGEHFTPRDIVNLTTELVFAGDDDALSKDGIIRTIYDPTAGTGGFLSSGMEYLHELNPNAVMRAFGQELNPESYAICKADMLIKGQDVQQIKLGNTLSNDQLANHKFDYMLSNPPFGVDWKKIEQEIKTENEVKGWDGRFGAGLPRVSDGSLLFLQHLISKMHDTKNNGSRIGIILNGSPLFTGSAGSGESEIRRYILESDLLEAIIALPTDMFYNTGISTYVWVLSNNQHSERRNKIQLINAANLASKMRKSLGSKRHYLDETAIKAIVKAYGELLEGESEYIEGLTSKIFAPHEFGYRRVTIERPLRLSAQMSDEKIEQLRFAPKPFNAIMQALVEHYGYFFTSQEALTEKAIEIRAMIKANFTELKEAQIKDVLDIQTWQAQADLFAKAQALQAVLGTAQMDDFNAFNDAFKKAEKSANVALTTKERKQIMDAITWKNPEAEPVVKKVLKVPANPLYGAFEHHGKVVEFEQDGDLRDYENIPLNPSVTTTELIETYVKKEVLPHVADAWINADKTDDKDKEIGIVGYEIPFNRHFYVYEPPRDLAVIDAELFAVSQEIMKLLEEVHS